MFPEGKQILIADDAAETAGLQALLRSIGCRVRVAHSARAALALAASEEFDLAMVGVGLAGGDDATLLRRLNTRTRIPSVLMLARPEDVGQAIRALSKGADDYLLKPPDRTEIQVRVGRILRWQDLGDRVVHLQKELSRKYILETLVSRSEGMKQVRRKILQVAAARSTVLIHGESGVGKELVAKAIHFNSPRREAPFIAINCSAIPMNLIESELFGHERGAFTGAIERQKGKFELAHGGTIFLDEISDMDVQTQARLLRVLEEREFMRVGGGRTVRVDVRVLAATNSDLESMISRGRFREDLFFRLNVITIRVPPLRERSQDVPDLARSLLESICKENGLPSRKLTGRAIQAFQRYGWPGNVRELKNVLESTAITRPGQWVRFSDLPARLRNIDPPRAAAAAPRSGASLEEVEREHLRRTLLRHGGNRVHAARTLRIGVRTLQRKIKLYRLGISSRRGRRPRVP